MGKKKEDVKLRDLEPSKDAKGGRATYAGILREGDGPKPYYFGTLRESPPTAKQVTRELWDSLVTLGRHRKIPSDENILLFLPSFIKRYEDSFKGYQRCRIRWIGAKKEAANQTATSPLTDSVPSIGLQVSRGLMVEGSLDLTMRTSCACQMGP